MFRINEEKLSDFDTQVLTLMNLSPSKWLLGSAPRLLCYHEDFGWFHRHWIFGVQPLIDGIASTRVREFTWRGQILIRRRLREMRRMAIDHSVPAQVKATTEPAPPTFPPITGAATPAAQRNMGMARSAHAAAAVQAQQNLHAARIQQLADQVHRQLNNDMLDAMRYQAVAMPTPQPPTMSSATLNGYGMQELVNKGADPSIVSAAFKGDRGAQDVLLKWADQHM